jgi:hydrogenase maturation protease
MSNSILLIGYGNPGRLDDGLGPALASKLEALSVHGLSVEVDYQLVVEHAHEIAKYDAVIFADSAIAGDGPYFFREIQASPKETLSSHNLSPETILFFAKTVFNAHTKGYVLGIRGYEFDRFGEYLSDKAKQNLDAAIEFLRDALKSETLFVT